MSYFDNLIEKKFELVQWERSNMHGYQQRARQFLWDNPFSALFIDMGLGKTIVSLTLIIDLLMDMQIENALVIAPLRVANNTWPDEIPNWRHTAPMSWRHIRNDELLEKVDAARKECRKRCKQAGETKERTKMLVEEEAKRVARLLVRQQYHDNPACVHLINREQVEFLVESWGADWPYKTVVIDESSSFKDHKTSRFKALTRVRPLIKRLHELTATPTAESMLHLFAQIYLLDRGDRFGKSYNKFCERYATQNRWSRKWELRPGAEEEIMAKVADICLTLKAEDYLQMPDKIEIERKVHLDKKTRKLYDDMLADFVIELENGVEIEAETAAAQSQKLLQMASGMVYETRQVDKGDGNFGKERVVHHLHDEKIEELRSIYEENLERPILVAYHHMASLDRLKKAFPFAVAMDKEGKCVKKWNDGKIQMLLVHPQSAGHGLNLQRGGNIVCFFDIPWSLELYLQLVGRLWRQGQSSAVRVYHLIAEGTIDEVVMRAIKAKRDAQDALFRYLKKLQRRRQAKVEQWSYDPDEL